MEKQCKNKIMVYSLYRLDV